MFSDNALSKRFGKASYCYDEPSERPDKVSYCYDEPSERPDKTSYCYDGHPNARTRHRIATTSHPNARTRHRTATTAIRTPGQGVVLLRRAAPTADLYDLQGRRIVRPTRPGIYIQAGNKMIIR